MAKRNSQAGASRPAKPAEKPAAKPAAKPTTKPTTKPAAKPARKKKPVMPEILADTAPEEREDVIMRVIKGLKKV